ncbi:MAG: DUF1361 domain-containing protein [Candidatus Levybacteria bacterium]|nr:DUF1361 domain-containing protein [Candidatus Levybacteria bacterium]
MPFFVDNFSWMAANTILAFVPVVLVVLLRQKMSRSLHLIVFFFWLLFLPNTIYLITDLQHVGAQLLQSPVGEQIILIFQYVTLAVLGVVTYVYSLEPVSTVLRKMRLREINKDYLYIVLNYIVASGVVLGKVQRTHSWYIFTEPLRVIADIIATITRTDLLIWIFLIGTIINVLFFLFRKYFPPLRNTKKSRVRK